MPDSFSRAVCLDQGSGSWRVWRRESQRKTQAPKEKQHVSGEILKTPLHPKARCAAKKEREINRESRKIEKLHTRAFMESFREQDMSWILAKVARKVAVTEIQEWLWALRPTSCECGRTDQVSKSAQVTDTHVAKKKKKACLVFCPWREAQITKQQFKRSRTGSK